MLFPVALLLQAQALSAAAPPLAPAFTATLPRLEATVRIDGVLDEPAWREAAVLGSFHPYQPVDSRPAEERTEVLVWYAPNAIYFGIVAHDRHPESIRSTVADRDNLDADDRVTIYLDTFNDRRRAFFFTVNPLGAQQDGVRTEGGFTAGNLVGGSTDRNPDFLWESKGQITDSGYVVEIRIPFKSLRYPGSGTQEWGLNIVRDIQRTGYEDTWTDTRRANASFLLQAGTLKGLHNLQRGVVTELQPFVTATANGEVDPAGAFERASIHPSAGLNLHFGLTSSLSLDGTYNPDFSQIESDVSLVTVNERFALFIPEKRPFFLEGIELFATPNQLVYTRQIVNPIAGGKLTTKIGRTNIAYLSSLDQPDAGDAFFNVARVRQDIGRNSTAGVTFTDRTESADFNRVLAGDARIVFGKLYYVAGQLGKAWTRSAGELAGAPLWEAEFDRTGRSWGFNYQLTGIGRDFESRAGFVPRNDIVSGHAFNRFSWYGGRGALLETIQVFFGPNRIWRYEDFGSESAIEGSESVDLNMQLRGGWKLSSHGEHNFVNFEPGAYSTYTVDAGGGLTTPYAAPGGVDNGCSVSGSITTPTFQIFDATAKLARSRGAIFAEGSEGYETRLTASLSMRPTNSIRIGALGTISRITRARDGSEFARTIIPRLKLEYQPTRALFFRVVGEYVAARRAALQGATSGLPLLVNDTVATAEQSNRLRLDWLASFEPVPGTVAFLGYGSSLEGDRSFDFGSMRRTSDGFFLKLAYQIRR